MECNNTGKFSKVTIREDCTDTTGFHEKELFYECKFRKLNKLTLKDCDLNQSEILTEKIEDAKDFTVTLNCFSFNGVKLTSFIFDLLLALLITTRGNDKKREMLYEVIGRNRAEALTRLLRRTE